MFKFQCIPFIKEAAQNPDNFTIIIIQIGLHLKFGIIQQNGAHSMCPRHMTSEFRLGN